MAPVGPAGSKQVSGDTMADKLKTLEDMTESGKMKFWQSTIEAGELLIMPAGHIIAYAAQSRVVQGIRWSLSTGSHSDKAAKRVVKDMLISYPKLKESAYSSVADALK